jgi:hypothetical protein
MKEAGSVKKVILAISALAFLFGVIQSSDAGSGSGSAAGTATTAGGKMPQIIILGSIAKTYEPVKFNHASHVSNASSCAECHHQHGTDQSLACGECHAIDSSAFKRSVKLSKMRPCGACHSATYPAGNPDRPWLKAAYHRACFKCHRGDVGSVGKDPKGCVEMCHVPRAQAKLEKKP